MVATAWFRSLSRRERHADEMNFKADCALIAADPGQARECGVCVEDVEAEQSRRRKALDYAEWAWNRTHG